MEWPGIDICSCVDQDTDILFGRQIGGDAGPLDPFECTKFDCRSGNGGTRVSRADDRFGLTILDKIDGTGNRRIFFTPHRLHGGIGHLDNLRCVNNFYPRIVTTEF